MDGKYSSQFCGLPSILFCRGPVLDSLHYRVWSCGLLLPSLPWVPCTSCLPHKLVSWGFALATLVVTPTACCQQHRFPNPSSSDHLVILATPAAQQLHAQHVSRYKTPGAGAGWNFLSCSKSRKKCHIKYITSLFLSPAVSGFKFFYFFVAIKKKQNSKLLVWILSFIFILYKACFKGTH